MELIEFADMPFLEFIKTTYPVSTIVMILAGFGAALAGFSRRAYFKNQNKLIASLESEVERLTK